MSLNSLYIFFFPIKGSIVYTSRNGDLLNFLVKFTPMFTLRLFFGLINLLVAFSPVKIVSLVTFTPLLFKNLCSSCQATYYRKISRHFIVRCREHLGISKEGKSVKGTSSAITDHIKDTAHSASLDNFCTIDRTNNELDLLIHESLLILRDRPTLNFQSSSIPLCLF